MGKRLNDTAAVAATPAFGHDPDRTSVSVCVEKIDNGYLKETSSYGEGGYRRTKTFTPTRPDPSPDRGSSMSRAREYLSRTRTD